MSPNPNPNPIQTFDADILLLETANNDLPEDTPAFREQALALNEIFARQLLELPLSRQPFLMWLETSWRGTPNPSPSPSPDTDPDPASRSSPLTPALTLP